METVPNPALTSTDGASIVEAREPLPAVLPCCGEPSTSHLEAYSDRLRAAFYACAEHTGAAIKAWEAAGFRVTEQKPESAVVPCGEGYDFATESRLTGVDRVSAAVVDDAEKALRAFEGDPLTREKAEQLLSMWGRSDELSGEEWAAVLVRFPETPVPDWDEIDAQLDAMKEDPLEETKELLRRIADKIQFAGKVYNLGIREGLRRGEAETNEQAWCEGYVDALSATLDPEPLALRFTDDGSTDMTDHERAVEYRDYLRAKVVDHAWIVRSVVGKPGHFVWTCACGARVGQGPEERHVPTLRARLEAAHIK